MAIKNLFVKDTRVNITWEDRFAKIQLVYNDIMAPLKTIIEHWERFNIMGKYFADENASYAIIRPSMFAAAMEDIEKLKAEYGTNKKMTFLYDDRVQNIKVLNAPPSDYIVKYERSGSELSRIIPSDVIESEDGWDIWKDYIWNYPTLQIHELQNMRSNKVVGEDIVKFLQQRLPKYRNTGLTIECDLEYKDENAVEIEIVHSSRDVVEFDVKWLVPMDSIDPELDVFGYVLSGNTVYSGLNPLEIEEYFPDLVGKQEVRGLKIAEFLDNAYKKWSSWIKGDVDAFEEIHHWLNPPYNTFLKVENQKENGIGKTIAKPYILIGNECLSQSIVDDIVTHSGRKYYHLRNGWIKADQFMNNLNKNIVSVPSVGMQTFTFNADQILHLGDSELRSLWGDIMLPDDNEWTENDTKVGIAQHHFDYMIRWGIDGGLSGGFEVFMAYGLPIVLDFILKNKELKPIFLADKEYVSQINTIVSNVQAFKDSRAEVVSYQDMKKKASTGFDISILIEPEKATGDATKDQLFEVMDNSRMCYCFTEKDVSSMSIEEEQNVANMLGINDRKDLKYLIRSITGEVSRPAMTKFTKNLHLKQTPLVFHEHELDLQ